MKDGWHHLPSSIEDGVWPRYFARYGAFHEFTSTGPFAVFALDPDPWPLALVVDAWTKMVDALCECVPSGGFVMVLEFQQEGALLEPHLERSLGEPPAEPWDYPPFIADGELVVTAALDLDWGLLSVPWGGPGDGPHVTVFGRPILQAIDRHRPIAFHEVSRSG